MGEYHWGHIQPLAKAVTRVPRLETSIRTNKPIIGEAGDVLTPDILISVCDRMIYVNVVHLNFRTPKADLTRMKSTAGNCGPHTRGALCPSQKVSAGPDFLTYVQPVHSKFPHITLQI